MRAGKRLFSSLDFFYGQQKILLNWRMFHKLEIPDKITKKYFLTEELTFKSLVCRFLKSVHKHKKTVERIFSFDGFLLVVFV